jgi:phosphate transport system permease protein
MDLSPSPSAPARILRKRSGAKWLGENLVKFVCFVCACVSLLTTFGIIYALVSEATHFFAKVPLSEFFGGTEWTPTYGTPKFGVLPLIGGTLTIMVGSGLLAIPIGLLIGVYLSEYASERARKVLKPVLEVLAGVPTVVFGFFGLFVVTPFLRNIIPGVQIYNALSGAIVVGIMILPLVASLCEDSIRAVPRGLREAAYGLGATKLEVTMKIVVPGALSGIMAAFILALSRAVGETMAVTLAAGATPKLTLDPRESIQTMTAYIVQISKGDTPAGTTAYYTLFAVGLTLFVITFLMNIAAQRLVRRYRQVYS